jgi:hypothetical protein
MYDTSREGSVSVLVWTGGSGTLFLKNQTTGEEMSIPYSYNAFGESKGADFGAAVSLVQTPSSGGYVNICNFSPSGDFGQGTFPCHGYLATMGGNTGGGAAGAGYALVIWVFGLDIEAAMSSQGQFMAMLPGVGMSIALTTFGAATMGDSSPPDDPTDPQGPTVASNDSGGGGDSGGGDGGSATA